MCDIQVASVSQDVCFFERNTHCIKAGSENSLSTALYRCDEIQGLPCISQITERKKTSTMYIYRSGITSYQFCESISSGMLIFAGYYELNNKAV